jgi:two-component system, LytTR family, sensor kinase
MLVSAAWIVPAIFGGVDAAVQPRLWGSPPAPLGAILFVAGDWLIYALLTPGVFAISQRWPIARPHLLSRVMLHFFVSLLFCAAWAGLGTGLRAFLQPQALEGNAWRSFESWLLVTFPFGVAVYLSMVGVEHAIRYLAEARNREIQMARLSEQLSSARFSALQAQVNPHFLFNTLNTITVLVRDGDRAGATQILEHLSEVLRSTLGRHRTNEVRLQEELELVRQYLAIEQARFSYRLRPEFEIDDSAMSAAVPGFALQHLVENAIRHGIAKRPDAGRVKVVARRDRDMLELSVADDGAGIADEAVMPAGHGIENTRERLRSLYGERASLIITTGAPTHWVAPGTDGGTIAVLRVPYREMVLESDVDTS